MFLYCFHLLEIKKEFYPPSIARSFVSVRFSEAKAHFCLFLSIMLLPLPVMSHRHSFPRDARSILGNTSCQFPMLYKVFPYKDRRPPWHTLFACKIDFTSRIFIHSGKRKMGNGDSAKKVAFHFSSFFSLVISRSTNVW